MRLLDSAKVDESALPPLEESPLAPPPPPPPKSKKVKMVGMEEGKSRKGFLRVVNDYVVGHVGEIDIEIRYFTVLPILLLSQP